MKFNQMVSINHIRANANSKGAGEREGFELIIDVDVVIKMLHLKLSL